MVKDANNNTMKVNGQEFITVKEMAKKLGVETNTIKQRLYQQGIKPVSKDALYDVSALEAIKDTVIGRPKKEEAPAKAKGKPPKKGKK
ncbi:MAG: hypothetical protein FWD28_02000 [Treponema sp.]|nr:hypothetical protein [Treponema sp.]